MDHIIPYGKQYISEADTDAVLHALHSDFLTQGPKVQEFEEKFASSVDAKYAVAVSNGTAALHLAALALGVDQQTRVITTPITFAATANCILYCGGQVEFADISSATATLDIDSVRKMLLSKPKNYYHGIIPVDLAGYPVDMEEFRTLADEHGLWIIEDACHAPGAHFTDSSDIKQKCGNGVYADIGIFSFHPVKHIATGEGGMITTNDKKLYEKLLRLRTHGITKDPKHLITNDGGWYYEMHELGFNYRIPDILCALGISQLDRLDQSLRSRAAIARKYDEAFTGNKFIEPLLSDQVLRESGAGHAYHLYIVRSKERLRLYNYLRSHKIYAQVHYIPVYRMPYYKGKGFNQLACPNADKYYDECLSLPMYPTLTNDEQQFVIDTITNFTKGL